MSQKELRKKQRERFFLNQFLERKGITPTGITPSETPDFLMELEGRTVGIEITEIFVQGSEWKPSPHFTGDLPLQARETYENRIVSRAERIYSETVKPLISVFIVFSNGINYATNRDGVAELIAHQVTDMSARNSHTADWKPGTHENEDDLLCDSVSFIQIQKVPEKRFARWTVSRAGLVATLTQGHLQNAINLKKEKLNEYKVGADEIWLVMFIDRRRPSQMLQTPPDFSLESISSPFDRTFYYCFGTNAPVIEL
jgi:hypothetical protein